MLHFLPPYCPDANRIERMWLDLHANVTRDQRCRTIQKFLRRVHATCMLATPSAVPVQACAK